MKLVTASEMREIESRAFAAGATVEGLMENAGRGVALAVRDHFGNVRARRIVILVGPGNNGGDGLVAARYLYELGASVLVCLLTPRPHRDPNLEALQGLDLEVMAFETGVAPELWEELDRAEAIIDAVLGTGSQRPLSGHLAEIFERLKSRRATLFAVDLPSGLNADTGALDPHACGADVTLTLGFSKVGLHLWPGSSLAGEVRVLDIGLDPAAGEELKTSLLTPDWAASVLPPRPGESNKGSFGRLMIVAGSLSYTGAAALSGLGALRAGAGLVTLASIAPVRAAVASYLPELTHVVLPETDGAIDAAAGDVIARALEGYDALLIGPGLGMSPGAQAVVRGLLSLPQLQALPVVVDADALNALARVPQWWEEVRCRAVLTPHPGELGRLLHKSATEVQQNRLDIATGCAAAWRQTLVLKGAHTVIASPDGRRQISPFANAALATAGTGDVLAGAIGGLLAQGVEPAQAAALAVYLHGAAAGLFDDQYGSSGLLASELGTGIARLAARLRRGA